MQFRRGFTLLEVLLAVAILGTLATLVVLNSSTARLRSRDANRRGSTESYRVSMEQYKTAKGTYFVQTGSCVQTGTAQQSGRDVYIQATGPGCTGLYGGGSGRITRRNSAANSSYAPLSVADALVREGFLSRIYTDPLDARLPYTSHSDYDYILTLCNEDGSPALAPKQAKEFAVYAAMESTFPREESTANQLCGGSNTYGGGWQYWLADTSALPARHFADVGASTAVSGTTTLPQTPQTLTLPKVEINQVTAIFSETAHEITGSFQASNPEAVAVGKLYFSASLIYDAPSGSQQVVADQPVNDLLTLGAADQHSFTYALPVSQLLNTGTYHLAIRGWTETGLPFAIQAKPVDITGAKNNFLDFDTAKAVLYRGTEVIPPLAAATFLSTQKVLAYVPVHNEHPLNYEVTPQITVYERAALPNAVPVHTEKLPAVIIKGMSTQDLTVTLPTLDHPESYYARVQLLDTAGAPVSGFQDFRWVVPGETGKILSTKVSGSQYLTRTMLSAEVGVVGPADGSSIETAHLAIRVLDATNDAVLYTDRLTINHLDQQSRVITAPVEFKSGLSSLKNVKVELTLQGTNDVTLHKTAAVYDLALERVTPPYYLVLPIILLLILMVALLRRHHRTMHYMEPTALVVALLLTGALYAGPARVLAATLNTAVQTTDDVSCTIAPIPQGNPAQCQTLWDNHIYPQVDVIRNYDKTTVAINDSVTLSVQFSLDPSNNGTVTGNLAATHAVQDPDPDCVDAINFSDNNINSGLWVKSITAVSAGTTDVVSTFHSTPSTECWQGNSCTVDNGRDQVITCPADQGNTTPTPTITPPPTATFTPPPGNHYIGNGSKLF